MVPMNVMDDKKTRVQISVEAEFKHKQRSQFLKSKPKPPMALASPSTHHSVHSGALKLTIHKER